MSVPDSPPPRKPRASIDTLLLLIGGICPRFVRSTSWRIAAFSLHGEPKITNEDRVILDHLPFIAARGIAFCTRHSMRRRCF